MPDQNSFTNYYELSQSTLSTQSILDVFVLQDLITQTDAEMLKSKLRTNRRIEIFLVKNRIVTKDTINKAYSIILKLPYVEIKNVIIPDDLKKIIPEKFVRSYGIIPFGMYDGVVRIAITRPADLLVNYQSSLGKIFAEKNLDIEIFITGESDFNAVVKQYSRRYKSANDANKIALPVVYLRNQSIASEYLNKIPRELIEKYRLVVFGQNKREHFLVACEKPDALATKKILDFIRNENNVNFEVFATSKDDIDFVLGNVDKKLVKNKELKEEKPAEKPTEVEDQAPREQLPVKEKEGSGKSIIENLLGSLNISTEPELTVDNIEVAPPAPTPDETEIPKPAEKKIDKADQASEQKTAEKTNPISEEVTQVTTSSSKPEVDDQPFKTEAKKPSDKKDDNFESKNLKNFLEHEIRNDADLKELSTSTSVPKIVAGILDFALNNRSSDIHVEPESKLLRIRCRVDGILRDIMKLPLDLHAPFVSRVKIMSRLKIDETRIPQDGRFETIFDDREVDVRVSTLPTIHGEKIVMRILDKSQGVLSLEDLGMQGSAFDKTLEAINKPYGIILSTGPTGSGKSTTLYAVLNRISLPGVNIVTLEDPVEYDIAGINQCQIKPEIGFSFASGLRSILRQDPNVIMVGEVRDSETAGMAVHAALTGHLVLSTLHTNDTAGSLPRLMDMGIEPFLVSSSINLILAQRLVRRICPKCKEELKVPQKLMDQITEELNKIPETNTKDRSLIPDTLRLYHGRGCDECNQGFKGRVGIFEAMIMNSEIEDMVIAKKSANEIKEATIRNGMITMKQDGIIKAITGMTTIDEVFQAVVSA